MTYVDICLKCAAVAKPVKLNYDGRDFEASRCSNPKCRYLWMTASQRQAFEERRGEKVHEVRADKAPGR